MSLEDEVKEALRKHGEDARPDQRSWNAVEKKVRRAHKQRFAYSSALSLVIIAAIAIVVWRPPIGNQVKGLTNPLSTPTETPTPSPSLRPSTTPTAQPHPTSFPEGFKTRAGVQAGFAVDIPKDWKGGWFEGYWDFEPAGLPSTAQGGDTFALVITVEPGSFRDATGGAKGTEITIGGRNGLTWATDPLHVSYAVDWPGCANYEPLCPSSTQRLIMRLFGSTQGLWNSYEALGRKAALTVHAYDGSEPQHGTLDSATKIDDFSKALVRFMDARVEGIGADELMSSSAADFYNTNGGLYDLNGKSVTSYEVAGPTRTTDTLENFGVTIHYSGGAVRQELITVQRNTAETLPAISNVCTGCD